jgi:nucleoside-diphosphate-sugar epimerase
MGKRILVTGGGGYIGSILVAMLVDRGYKVRVLDKLYFGRAPLAGVCDRIELIIGDIRNLDPAVLKGVDAVMHLASLSNDPTGFLSREATRSVNYEGSIKLARACRECGISRFTFASSCSVYGFLPENILTETDETSPQSEYAASKLEADIELQKMAGDGFCPVILRQATVFGFSPRMRWDLVVNAFVMHAFKGGALEVWFGGDALRPLVHVRDAAEAHIRCLEAEESQVSGQVFNIVHDNCRILDLAQQVRECLSRMGIDVTLNINYDQVDHRSYRVSGNKAAEVLGYTPSISVADGVKEIAGVLRSGQCRDFDNPIYYNVRWLKLLIELEDRLKKMGSVL